MSGEELLGSVDLGGTKLSVGLVRQDGRVLDKVVAYDHNRKTEPQLVGQICGLVRGLLAARGLSERDLLGVGMGFAGHVRFRDGVVITTSNFPGFKMKNFSIRAALEEELGMRVVLDNDANAQAYAEFCFGAGRGYESMIFLTVSTGIGAGLVLGGRLYRGMTGTAGEFGHTIVNPHSDIRCGCGNYGCLMSHASGLVLPQLVKKKLDQGVSTSLPPAQLEAADGRLLKQGLEAGDELCRQVIVECADYVGIGVYNLFQIFNPPVIVLGGGLINWGSIYLERIKEKFHALAGDMLFDPMEIRVAQMGAEAGLIGAAALLLEAP
jgi:glucokinase